MSAKSQGAVVFFIGGLICAAAVYLFLQAQPAIGGLLLGLGGVYLGVGALGVTGKASKKVLALMWLPFLLVSPRLGLQALENVEDEKTAEIDCSDLPPMARAKHAIYQMAWDELEIRPQDAKLRLEIDLGIPAGRQAAFLEDLFLEYDFPVSAADAINVNTLDEIASLVESRLASRSGKSVAKG